MALMLLVLSCAPVAADTDLEVRASALRERLAAQPSDDRRALVERQLLASLDRRKDLARSAADFARLADLPAPDPEPVPPGLLALDDLRRELQQLDLALAGAARRIEILREDRAAAATQLRDAVAVQRGIEDGAEPDPTRLDEARIEARLAESTTAELDALLALVEVQQAQARKRRSALLPQLAAAASARATPEDAGILAMRMRTRTASIDARIAQATTTRESARTALQVLPQDTPPARKALHAEQVASADIELELAREAAANLAIERTAWDLALRVHGDGDVDAALDARARGPAIRARLQRRREFLAAMAQEVLARLGALEESTGRSTSGVGFDVGGALRPLLEQRLRSVQAALLDESRLEALLERLREGFDERAGRLDWRGRFEWAVAHVRHATARAWQTELFAVDQAIEVDGRQTLVARPVTVGKVVKAPLLLLCTLLLAVRASGWGARWARRRYQLDEDRTRLLRRWTLSALVCVSLVASLVVSGIPLAAFAFIGGAVALGAGIGMQSLLKNLISGVLVLLERPFRLGDVIEVGNIRGTVVDIDLRACVVRDSDGDETLVPNATLVDQSVKNITFRSRHARQSLALTVDAGADPRIVSDAMQAAAARHGLVLESPGPSVLLEDIADDGLRFALHYWLELGPGVDRRTVASDLRLMILRAFAEAGVGPVSMRSSAS